MAIYRPKLRRWPVVLAGAAVGVVLGFVLGWTLRGGGAENPADAVRRLRSSLTGAAGTLEVVDIEYRESVQDGRVVSPPEYRGALDALGSSRDRYQEAREALDLIDPTTGGEADRLYDELEALMDQLRPADEVSSVAGELAGLLRDAVPGEG